MKKVFLFVFFAGVFQLSKAQEAFLIRHYSIDVKINKNASLDFTETLDVHFAEPRHGIIRSIQYQYPLQSLPAGVEKAERQMEANGYAHIIIENIKVPHWKFSINKSGDYENIRIGSSDKYVEGDQQYVIKYQVLNAINFFQNHSEFYYNLIGNQWATTIDSAEFKVELPQALRDTPYYFVASGSYGSKENNTVSKWTGNRIFTGHITKALRAHEGLTVGIAFPKDFLIKPDYTFRGVGWLTLPVIVLIAMYYTWKKWGKDEQVTIQTEYYPPENISPSISGYIIDDKLNQRDLTALVPYWGAGGFLKVNETQKSSLLGIIKSKDFEFIKVKELPETALQFEKTLFAGIFETGDKVKLSDLKNVLYSTMEKAKSQLENEINEEDYYVKYSRGMGCFFPFLGFASLVIGFFALVDDWQEKLWLGIALIVSGIILIAFGFLMTKKTRKGTLLFQKLLGFKEFIKTVEKDRLQEFLKQDENYFDKVLPYAIVFDMADKWKDKLKGLEIPPPKWYSGYYPGSTFNTMMFMNSLDHSMNEMTNTFYSSPHSSGSSGGSFSGGGGFSGGGFGGGGGSSW
jgi:uncharacterized membrane protein YgcG